MGLMQYIYTSVLVEELTAQRAFETSAMSVKLCQQFGITGRVFANRQQALAITEGPETHVARYFEAVQKDPMAGTQILHLQRPIKLREFTDYSVWLNLGRDFEFTEHVRHLTLETLALAWPKTLSSKVRIIASAYLDADMLAAP